MKTVRYTVTDPVGIHARPAGNLVREIKNFESDATISANGKTVDAKKLMMVMTLGVKQGQEIELTFTGPDEDKAAEAVSAYMKDNL